MSTIFLTSDTHFGHANICRFTNPVTGGKLRPWDSVEDMDEEMVRRWNERVGPKDKVYHLGDVVINRRALPIMERLNGDKVLIRGNHDIFPDEEYNKYFRSLRGYHVMDGMILSHIPIHSESLGRFGVNIHGHLHATRVMRPLATSGRLDQIDPRYHCVCVEQTDFAPIALDEVLDRIRAEGGHVGFHNGNS